MDLSITHITWHKYTYTYTFLLPDCFTKGINEVMVLLTMWASLNGCIESIVFLGQKYLMVRELQLQHFKLKYLFFML